MIAIFFLPLIFWLCLNTGTSMLLKRKFGETMPLTMISAALIMYFSQLLFHTFSLGYRLLLIFAAVSIVCLLLGCRKRTGKNMITPGLIMFLVIYVLCFAIDFQHRFTIFDEFYHWGTMVKESLRLDRFYSVQESNLWIHKDYPPFACMLELIWCKLVGKYSEMTVLVGLHVFNFSIILCPLMEHLKTDAVISKIKLVISEVLLFFLTYTVILAFDQWPDRVSTSLLVDITVPLMFAYVMLNFYWSRRNYHAFDYFVCFLGCTAILMTKQIGIAFVMLIVVWTLILRVNIKGRSLKNSKKIVYMLPLAVSILLPIAVIRGWNHYVKKLGIVGQFDPSIFSLKEYLGAFRSPGLRHDTLKHYINALLTENIGTSSWLEITYVSAFLLAIVILIVLWIKGTSERRIIYRKLAFVFSLGTVGYALTMSVTYLFGFNETEMQELASYGRYMSAYVVGEAVILLCIILDTVYDGTIREFNIRRLAIITLSAIVGFNPANMLYMVPQKIRGNNYESQEKTADYISSRVKDNSSIFVIYDCNQEGPNWWGAYQVFLQYYLNSYHISREYVGAFALDFSEPENVHNVVSAIADCDYVFVKNSGDNINGELADTLSCKFEDDAIYQVQNDQGQVSLVRMK